MHSKMKHTLRFVLLPTELRWNGVGELVGRFVVVMESLIALYVNIERGNYRGRSIQLREMYRSELSCISPATSSSTLRVLAHNTDRPPPPPPVQQLQINQVDFFHGRIDEKSLSNKCPIDAMVIAPSDGC